MPASHPGADASEVQTTGGRPRFQERTASRRQWIGRGRVSGLRFTPALNAPSFAIEGALRLDRDARELRYLEVQNSRLHIWAPRVDRSRRVRAIDEIGCFVLDIREPWER